MSSPYPPQGSTPDPWQHQPHQQPTYHQPLAPFTPGAPVRWVAGQIGPAGLPVKSKVAAGLLGIFLGSLGVHNFYLGRIGIAVTQLVLWLVAWPTSLFGLGFVLFFGLAVWSLVEGILCFTGGIRDGQGQPLGD